MNRRDFLQGVTFAAAATMTAAGPVFAAGDGQRHALPKPDVTQGRPLMACLAARRSNRALGREDLDWPTLGALLWAAWGINRDNGRHVIPTAMDRRQLAVFAVRGDGVWEYLPKEHAIKRVLDGDRRGRFDASGLVLLYAAPGNDRFAPMHVGSMYQNVGLYCASVGLASCVKYQQHEALDAELPLPAGWMTYITQSVAHPAR
ncbi:MAG: nitroreductase family protein [Desulfovibrio sp.]|nr:nitroreductase family protein [Desulfovibrio sp.]